jgi:hypothetical protein
MKRVECTDCKKKVRLTPTSPYWIIKDIACSLKCDCRKCAKQTPVALGKFQ